MRQQIQTAVQIFRANPELDDDEILQRVMDTGVEKQMAVQLVTLLPLAYGRVALSDMGLIFTNTYLCLGQPGKGRLDALPLWAEALDFAKQDPEPSFPIASRSPEIRAANSALNDGQKLESLVWSPPAFLWPIEPIPGQEQTAKKKSNWLQRIWDDPADYSVTCGERIITRIVMVIAILVGLFALSLVAYYAIPLLRR